MKHIIINEQIAICAKLLLKAQSRHPLIIVLALSLCLSSVAETPSLPIVRGIEIQPLSAQVKRVAEALDYLGAPLSADERLDRKSTRLNSSHRCISYAVFCLKKKRHTRKSA